MPSYECDRDNPSANLLASGQAGALKYLIAVVDNDNLPDDLRYQAADRLLTHFTSMAWDQARLYGNKKGE